MLTLHKIGRFQISTSSKPPYQCKFVQLYVAVTRLPFHKLNGIPHFQCILQLKCVKSSNLSLRSLEKCFSMCFSRSTCDGKVHEKISIKIQLGNHIMFSNSMHWILSVKINKDQRYGDLQTLMQFLYTVLCIVQILLVSSPLLIF